MRAENPNKILGALVGLALSIPGWSADWSPRLAADYLDQRQKQWVEWAPAKAPGGTCVSCHTGVTYLLARPMLRRALQEKSPTVYEDGLLNGLRTRAANGTSMFPGFRKEPLSSQARNFEAAVAMLVLKPEERPAKDRLASFENAADGEKGLWGFQFTASVPWESDSSSYFTAALVALANKDSQNQSLRGASSFLTSSFSTQPLHQKLMGLWAGVLDNGARAGLEKEIWKLQALDGSWSDDSLGPWPAAGVVADKPDGKGPSAYATAFITFVLEQSGTGCTDERLTRAKAWLVSHQEAKTGAWRSTSMNKKRPPESMPAGFMDDAATAFAVMALLDPGSCSASTAQRAAK